MKAIKCLFFRVTGSSIRGKVQYALLPLLVVALIGIVPVSSQAAPASERFPDYFVLKGGAYTPSERFSLDEFDEGIERSFDRERGMNAEIAMGHYYSPVFGMEFGVGYFETRPVPTIGPGRTRIEAIPLLLSAKLFLPLGPIEPYGEVGVGAYFSRFESEGTIDRKFREIDYGPHAGLGLNINFTDTFYLGVEGRYRKVKPDYDGLHVRLDGYTATMNLGFRY